jgi:hypothetical protein
MIAFRRFLLRVASVISSRELPRAIEGAKSGTCGTEDHEIAKEIRNEIESLKQAITDAKTELYTLNLSYATVHFNLHETRTAHKIESMRQGGAGADVKFLKSFCDNLEAKIASYRVRLSTAGIDPDRQSGVID